MIYQAPGFDTVFIHSNDGTADLSLSLPKVRPGMLVLILAVQDGTFTITPLAGDTIYLSAAAGSTTSALSLATTAGQALMLVGSGGNNWSMVSSLLSA